MDEESSSEYPSVEPTTGDYILWAVCGGVSLITVGFIMVSLLSEKDYGPPW